MATERAASTWPTRSSSGTPSAGGSLRAYLRTGARTRTHTIRAWGGVAGGRRVRGVTPRAGAARATVRWLARNGAVG
eukprot:5310410-Prymnesium_polylepis.1